MHIYFEGSYFFRPSLSNVIILILEKKRKKVLKGDTRRNGKGWYVTDALDCFGLPMGVGYSLSN